MDARRIAGLLFVSIPLLGDPNGPGLPKWPQYHQKNDVALELGAQVTPIVALHKLGLDFLEGYFAGLRTEK